MISRHQPWSGCFLFRLAVTLHPCQMASWPCPIYCLNGQSNKIEVRYVRSTTNFDVSLTSDWIDRKDEIRWHRRRHIIIKQYQLHKLNSEWKELNRAKLLLEILELCRNVGEISSLHFTLIHPFTFTFHILFNALQWKEVCDLVPESWCEYWYWY